MNEYNTLLYLLDHLQIPGKRERRLANIDKWIDIKEESLARIARNLYKKKYAEKLKAEILELTAERNRLLGE